MLLQLLVHEVSYLAINLGFLVELLFPRYEPKDYASELKVIHHKRQLFRAYESALRECNHSVLLCYLCYFIVEFPMILQSLLLYYLMCLCQLGVFYRNLAVSVLTPLKRLILEVQVLVQSIFKAKSH